jgi:hypothetical protein
MGKLLIVTFFVLISCCWGISESERVANRHQIYGSWPLNLHDESIGSKELNAAREAEIMAIPGSHERWENWMQFVAGQLVPKLTTHGFELVKTPPAVHAKLREKLEAALVDWDSIPFENNIPLIYGPLPPKFVNIGSLAMEVNADLLSLHEQWAGGIKLRGTSSYGLRLYQNGSSLVMHRDKVCLYSVLILLS